MTRAALEQDTGREPWRPRVAELAEVVVRRTLAKPPTLGGGRLVCVDGPAGSGKSTLGQEIRDTAAGVGSAGLVHLDDLLDGWAGLDQVSATLEHAVLAPLSEGRAGRYRRYDWHLERFAEERVVEPVDLLVVEGVGSGASSYASWVTTLIWVEAPADLRLARGLARDGEELLQQWTRWMADEDALFSRERTRDRAHVLVDGTGGSGWTATQS